MSPRNVVVLAFDGVQILDVTGPLEVFDEACRFTSGPRPYRVHCLGVDPAPVRASNGLRLAVDRCTASRRRIDTLVVPGGLEESLERLRGDDRFMAWLARSAGSARRAGSVCTGAFLLAAAGLLDDRRATTHWAAVQRLRRAVPKARIEPDALHTRDGPIHTSAGVTAGIDLALALVEEDLGRAVATAIARNLVLYLRRPGYQSQFSAPLRAQARERVIDGARALGFEHRAWCTSPIRGREGNEEFLVWLVWPAHGDDAAELPSRP